MKHRKGYSPITVSSRKYTYNVCLNAHYVFIYDEQDKKHSIDMHDIPKGNAFILEHAQWRGKHDAGSYSKPVIAEIIRQFKL